MMCDVRFKSPPTTHFYIIFWSFFATFLQVFWGGVSFLHASDFSLLVLPRDTVTKKNALFLSRFFSSFFRGCFFFLSVCPRLQISIPSTIFRKRNYYTNCCLDEWLRHRCCLSYCLNNCYDISADQFICLFQAQNILQKRDTSLFKKKNIFENQFIIYLHSYMVLISYFYSIMVILAQLHCFK